MEALEPRRGTLTCLGERVGEGERGSKWSEENAGGGGADRGPVATSKALSRWRER